MYHAFTTYYYRLEIVLLPLTVPILTYYNLVISAYITVTKRHPGYTFIHFSLIEILYTYIRVKTRFIGLKALITSVCQQ